MVSAVDAYRVFIASPGGLTDERVAIREEIKAFNSLYMLNLKTAFDPCGWEDVPGSARRPQGVINEFLSECDYMILVLGSRWGSAPARDGAYSSGVEEEFFTAKRLLEDARSPMIDILVLFKGIAEDQLRDPGPQLQKVLDFKISLDDERAVYYKDFDNLDGLRAEVANRLQRWAAERQGGASSRPSELTSRIGSSSAGRVPVDDRESSIEAADDALVKAEQYESEGLVVQAEGAYVIATAEGDLESLQKFARFLRRTGRLAKSLDVNQQILALLASSGRDQESLEVRARTLCNAGIIERKLGNLASSRSTLREAVRTAQSGGTELLETLAYALDNLSITVARNGGDEEAAGLLQEALSSRRMINDEIGVAKTLINLARLHKRGGDLELAKGEAIRAVDVLAPSPEKSALASAHAALGEIYEAEGNAELAYEEFNASLEINESLGLPDAIALSLTEVARVLLDRGDLAAAERQAQRALDENDRASNREGVMASNHLLGRVYAATARLDLAIVTLEKVADDYSVARNPTGEAWARLHLAEAQLVRGDKPSAQDAIDRARFLAGGVPNSMLRKAVSSFQVDQD